MAHSKLKLAKLNAKLNDLIIKRDTGMRSFADHQALTYDIDCLVHAIEEAKYALRINRADELINE